MGESSLLLCYIQMKSEFYVPSETFQRNTLLNYILYIKCRNFFCHKIITWLTKDIQTALLWFEDGRINLAQITASVGFFNRSDTYSPCFGVVVSDAHSVIVSYHFLVQAKNCLIFRSHPGDLKPKRINSVLSQRNVKKSLRLRKAYKFKRN